MTAVRARVALALVLMLGIAVLAAPTPAHAVANMGDAPLSCSYTVSVDPDSINNGFVAWLSGTERVYFDHRVQYSTAPGCNPRVRGQVNFRCQSYSAGAWDAANCGAQGSMMHRQDDALVDSSFWGYDFGSTGPDGTISVYSAWTRRYNCRWYTSDLFIDHVVIGGASHPIGEKIGASHDYLSPCPV